MKKIFTKKKKKKIVAALVTLNYFCLTRLEFYKNKKTVHVKQVFCHAYLQL